MNYQAAWDSFRGSWRGALLQCALQGRYYTRGWQELIASSWDKLPETVRTYLQDTDWEFAIGKCRYQW